MSPNEFQLRAALRDGEGEHVNPDTVIARARGMQQARHDRRVRFGSVAAAVAIVGGIGVVGSVILASGDGSQKSSADKGNALSTNRAARAAGAASTNTAALPRQPIAAGPMADAQAVPCPQSPPNLLLPGGGGSGQFGAKGALFTAPVESVKVCAYPLTAAGVSPATVLSGASASDLVKSLEASATALPATMKCPGGPAPTDRGALVIIGVDTGGKAMKPVVVTLTCPTRVTNGTALRYNWTPPASITTAIDQQISTGPVRGPISIPPPGKVTGSPIQS